MGFIKKIELPDNNIYDIKNTIIPVIGTQTTNTGNWTGNIDIPHLYNGLTIAYFLPYAPSGNATLNLTLSDGTTTGPINCYYNTGRLTTHYGKGSNIIMTFWGAGSISVDGTATTDDRWIAQADYNTDATGYYLRRIYPNLKAGTNKIFPYTMIMQNADGRWESIVTSNTVNSTKTRNTHGFRLGQVLLMYANATYNADALVGTYNIYTMNSGLIDHRYSFNTENNATKGTTGYKPVYLVGTINSTDGLFYLDETWWTQTLPSTDDGKVYIYIGDAYDYYRMTFVDTQKFYKYTNGALREISQDTVTVNGHAVNKDVPSDAVFTDTTYSAGNGLTLTGTSFNVGKRWSAVSQGQKWSRLYAATPVVSTVGTSGFLNITATRGSVVVNASFLVTSSHAGTRYVHITQIDSNNYTPIRVRGVAKSNGEYYFEVYDTAQGIASGAAQSWHCCFIPLADTTLTTYTTFTDGSTIPSGYSAFNDFTTTVYNEASAIKNISRSGTTFTATKQDGSTFTFTQQDNDTKNTAGSTDTSSKIFLIGATSQAANPQTYSHDTAYVGADGYLYSNSKQAVNLSDSQALTNKTYEGFTLAAACAKGVVTSIDTSANLPTSNAVKTYVDTAIDNLPEPMVFKGSLGTGGTITALPVDGSAKIGDTYKVITDGTYNGQAAKVGDLFICDSKTETSNTWTYIPSADEPSGTVTSVTIKATSPIAIDSSSAITTSGTRTISHANSGVSAGTYRSVTVNATGHVTGGTNPTTLSGYGITDAKISNGVITLGSNTITPLTSHQTVTDNNPTLSWGTKSKVATIGSTDINVTMPSNPNTDTKVNVTLATTTKAYLLGTSTTPTSTAQDVTSLADTGVYLTTTAGQLAATTFAASSGVYVNTANSGSAGGIALYATSPTDYGIAMRGTGTTTGNLGKHGFVQGDWAGYFNFTGAVNRGWIFRHAGTNIGSINGEGKMVLNGSLTVGGNTTNTSGCRLEYNTTTESLDFIFN